MLASNINPLAGRTYDELLAETKIIRLFGVHIHGVEVTQAIQHYRSEAHLTDRQDRGRDNGVTLVAGKPAWVRVYVRSGLLVGQVPNVTGQLEILRRSAGLYYNPVATRLPPCRRAHRAW